MQRAAIFIALSVLSFAAGAADTYVVDGNHTFPSFAVSHFGFSTYRGRFDRTSGTILLNLKKKSGSADILIDVTSVNTGVKKLDEHLQEADFFDTARYPTMTFKSKDFTFHGDKLTGVEGQLTIKGVTKPVTLKITSFSCRNHPMKKVPACGADAETTIKRSDFGVSAYSPNIGEEVKLFIEVEAQQQPD